MPYTLYDGSVTLSLNAMDSLKAILEKASGAPNASSLPEAKIHPDMLDLIFQVHISTETVAKLYARTTGTEAIELERDLKTFEDFFARIDKVKALLSKADKNLIDSRADELVPVGMGPGKTIQMPSAVYVTSYAVPNIFFHVSTAYNICRKNNVELGKRDFLTPFMADYMPK